MFLPIKTEAHDGRFRVGAIGIIVLCFLAHILVSRDQSAHRDLVTQLEDEVLKHKSDAHVDEMVKDVGGEDVMDNAASKAERDSSATDALVRLQAERK